MKGKTIALIGVGLAGAYLIYRLINRPTIVKKKNAESVNETKVFETEVEKPCKKWSNNLCIKAPCNQTCLER